MSILSRKIGRDGAEDGVFRPQITSLIDVMTILLIFLIKNFSVDSHVVAPPPNVDLPLSTSEKAALSRCGVTITKQEIIAGDMALANVADVEKSDSLVIEPLYTMMKTILPGCMVDDKGSIVILCDRDVNFSVVKKVMASTSRAGVSDFSILVLREGD
jgi:biopolymer transport protein ExbD